MQDFNDNGKVAKEGRKKPLQAEEANLRDQIPDALLKVVKEKDIGQKVVEAWNNGNALREDQLERQRKLLIEIDEFIEPIYKKPLEWQSDLHMPLSYIICKTFHARMLSAIFPDGEKVQVKARKEANVDRSNLVQELMHYSLDRWANYYQGVESEVDRWLWEWITTGTGIIKQKWHKQYSRFVDIEEIYVEAPGQEINGRFLPGIQTLQKAVKKDELTFEGPCWINVANEDLLIVGGDGDPDKADFVCEQLWYDASELWSLVDQKIFDRAAVEAVIDAGSNKLRGEPVNQIINQRAERSGEGGSLDDQKLVDTYQILEAYVKLDLDGSGIASDVVVWVHKETREILRATYLYRINKSGQKPYQVIQFHTKAGQQSAVGLIELTYPLAKEYDAMSNMKRDFGLLSTIPIGFYRASSSLSKETIPLTPGALIPLNDPQRDINFPQMGARWSFAQGEEQSLFATISRVTGLSDLNFGSLSSQGATRTARGVSAIAQESNANLDVFLRRANRGFRKALNYLYQMLLQDMPDGLEFRIFGDDGNNYFRTIRSKTEISGSFDFEVNPNSAASNQQIRIEVATQAMQLTQNPLLLQLGVVTPRNLFEATKNYMIALGIKDWSRFITPPQQGNRAFTPLEIANRVLAGSEIALDPTQDLQGFIVFAQDFLQKDELLGQFNEQQVQALAAKMQEAAQLQAALQQQQAQVANQAQMMQNRQAGTAIIQPGGGAGGE
jgi:hypothetical protein